MHGHQVDGSRENGIAVAGARAFAKPCEKNAVLLSTHEWQSCSNRDPKKVVAIGMIYP